MRRGQRGTNQTDRVLRVTSSVVNRAIGRTNRLDRKARKLDR